MGTNYYLITDVCTYCGRRTREHIGKKSAGWKFTFYLPKHYDSVSEYIFMIWFVNDRNGNHIEDEYGKKVSFKELEKIYNKEGDVGNKRVDEDGYVYERYEFC